MRHPALAALVLLACCGGSRSADARLVDQDAAIVIPDAPVPDASAPDASTLGQLCVSAAGDGGPGSCSPGALCCSSGGTTVCRLPTDCPGGAGYKACVRGMDCQGSICCQLTTMQFCTKTSACASYGGTEVP